MTRTQRHVWLVFTRSRAGVLMSRSLGVPAAFFTRDDAKRWARYNCASRPLIVKSDTREPR